MQMVFGVETKLVQHLGNLLPGPLGGLGTPSMDMGSIPSYVSARWSSCAFNLNEIRDMWSFCMTGRPSA